MKEKALIPSKTVSEHQALYQQPDQPVQTLPQGVIPIRKLSENRDACMGFAMLLILFCHNKVITGHASVNRLMDFLRQFTQFGVDIFLLVSGFGCWFSYTHDPSPLRFWKKRFLRVLPAYLIVLAIWSIFDVGLFGSSVGDFFFHYGLITFFTHGQLYRWYIAAILLLYLLFPLLYSFVNTVKRSAFIAAVIGWFMISGIFALCADYIPDALTAVNETFLPRIPVFLAGMWLAKRMSDDSAAAMPKRLLITVFAGTALLCLIVLYLDFPGSLWCTRPLFLPMSLSVCLLLSGAIQKKQALLWRVIGWIGSLTLEMYLLQEKVQMVFDHYVPYTGTTRCLVIYGAVLAITLLLSVALQKISRKIVQCCCTEQHRLDKNA